MKRALFGLAALVLLFGAVGQARGGLIISADFAGISDDGEYNLLLGPIPVPPSLIRAGFTYSDNGTVTTLSAYIRGYGFPDSIDTWGSGSLSFHDSPDDPINSMFTVGADRTVTLSISGEDFPATEGFHLAGTAHLRPDNTVDPSSFSLYALSGGEIAYIGGPLTQLIPEPSTLILLGMGAVSLVGFRWRRRKLAMTA